MIAFPSDLSTNQPLRGDRFKLLTFVRICRIGSLHWSHLVFHGSVTSRRLDASSGFVTLVRAPLLPGSLVDLHTILVGKAATFCVSSCAKCESTFGQYAK